MKYSYAWLKEITGTKKTPEQLVHDLMMAGFEMEEMESLADRWRGFVVGKVLEVEPHPNADRLKKVVVDIGEKKLNIVCGAPNVAVGLTVAVASVGAVLPKNKVKISKQQVRGEWSEGMLCSEDELVLGKDAGGIMVLDNKLKAGESLAKALGLDDWVLDLKVLPNRAHDCLSHQGMAREILVQENKRLKDPAKDLPEKNKLDNDSLLQIKIENKKLCPRYIGGIFSKIKVGPSPDWLRARLIACGMEPINNVVDITNLVMLETGNPLHAFDQKKLSGQTIFVRQAGKKEHLELLGDKFLVLDQADLVIADSEKVLALAGIKGGRHSGIDEQTSQVVLEAANFDLFSIRKTRQRHSLTTESQLRFEKGLSPDLTGVAFLRAAELLKKYAGAEFVGWAEEKAQEEKVQRVYFSKEKTEKLLGREIEVTKAEKILENLGFSVDSSHKDKKGVFVQVPYWRLDIEGGEDLTEEIGRIEGYEKVALQPLGFFAGDSQENFSRKLEWRIKERLASLGFDETPNYSFYGEKDLQAGKMTASHWELENYLSVEQSILRQTLLAGLFSFTAVNRSYFDRFSLFEMGRTFWEGVGDKAVEKTKIAGLVFDKDRTEKELYYLTKARVEKFLEFFSSQKVEFSSKDSADNFSGAGFFQAAGLTGITLAGKDLGILGIASEKTAKTYGFKEKAVAFELDFAILEGLFEKQEKRFSSLNRFPSVKRDLSMFVDLKCPVAKIEKVIFAAGGKNLEKLELFDVFENEKEQKKSLAFHLIFSHKEKTLASEEVERLMEKIILALEKAGASPRKK